ncbi:hypothetical protein Q7P37_009397 [Cladosporium fusiforme]
MPPKATCKPAATTTSKPVPAKNASPNKGKAAAQKEESRVPGPSNTTALKKQGKSLNASAERDTPADPAAETELTKVLQKQFDPGFDNDAWTEIHMNMLEQSAPKVNKGGQDANGNTRSEQAVPENPDDIHDAQDAGEKAPPTQDPSNKQAAPQQSDRRIVDGFLNPPPKNPEPPAKRKRSTTAHSDNDDDDDESVSTDSSDDDDDDDKPPTLKKLKRAIDRHARWCPFAWMGKIRKHDKKIRSHDKKLESLREMSCDIYQELDERMTEVEQQVDSFNGNVGGIDYTEALNEIAVAKKNLQSDLRGAGFHESNDEIMDDDEEEQPAAPKQSKTATKPALRDTSQPEGAMEPIPNPARGSQKQANSGANAPPTNPKRAPAQPTVKKSSMQTSGASHKPTEHDGDPPPPADDEVEEDPSAKQKGKKVRILAHKEKVGGTGKGRQRAKPQSENGLPSILSKEVKVVKRPEDATEESELEK